MDQLVDLVLIVVLALNFVALGVSRIRSVINAVAFQGMVLGLLPMFVHPEMGMHTAFIGSVVVFLKGFVIPGLLIRAMREARIQHEVRPAISFVSSLLLGGVGTGLALIFSRTLPLAEEHASLLLVPASFATAWAGCLLLTSRRKAIMQVLGYLLLENGIFLFGLLLLKAMPFLVEVGVMLDLFTGVFVMGIIIHHISQEFESTSTEHLRELKE
jgi:hydrogenase-4 component E